MKMATIICLFLMIYRLKKRLNHSLSRRDFLAHEFSNTDEYEDTDFVNIDTSYKWPGRLFNDFVLNLMMNAADGGSEYAKALFLYNQPF